MMRNSDGSPFREAFESSRKKRRNGSSRMLCGLRFSKSHLSCFRKTAATRDGEYRAAENLWNRLRKPAILRSKRNSGFPRHLSN